jgi:hypothetical protein
MVRSAPFARLRTMLCIAGNHEATQPPSNKPSLAITSFDWQDEARHEVLYVGGRRERRARPVQCLRQGTKRYAGLPEERSMAFSPRPHSGIEPSFAAECRCSAQARPGLDRRRFAPSHDLRRCKYSNTLSLSHLRLKNCADSGPFLSQDGIDHSVKYTPRPRYSSAAKSALLGGSEFCHGSARTRIQRIDPELYAIGAACECMGQ